VEPHHRTRPLRIPLQLACTTSERFASSGTTACAYRASPKPSHSSRTHTPKLFSFHGADRRQRDRSTQPCSATARKELVIMNNAITNNVPREDCQRPSPRRSVSICRSTWYVLENANDLKEAWRCATNNCATTSGSILAGNSPFSLTDSSRSRKQSENAVHIALIRVLPARRLKGSSQRDRYAETDTRCPRIVQFVEHSLKEEAVGLALLHSPCLSAVFLHVPI